ncbi:hypothetical protein BJV82DRAFT_574487 [Fennellomyces sp. T-0311]|nr:hypothetical protein BJV82DRAFT_574487 [Fennellomyces sp. T-0311]
MGEHRTQLHNSVRYWLLGFGFAGHDAPVDIATRRTALINYLLVDMRNINQLTPEDIQLHRTGDEDMETDQDGICLDNRDQFGFDSSWEDSYNDFLDSNGTVGALINWESVETSITDDVGSTLRSGNRSGVNQLFRRFVAAELEHQQ